MVKLETKNCRFSNLYQENYTVIFFTNFKKNRYKITNFKKNTAKSQRADENCSGAEEDKLFPDLRAPSRRVHVRAALLTTALLLLFFYSNFYFIQFLILYFFFKLHFCAREIQTNKNSNKYFTREYIEDVLSR